jgi:hypothetical protein
MTARKKYFVARHKTTDYLNIPVFWDTTSADRHVWPDVSEDHAAFIFRAVYFFGTALNMKATNSSQTQGLYAAQHDIVSQQAGIFVVAAVNAADIASN